MLTVAVSKTHVLAEYPKDCRTEIKERIQNLFEVSTRLSLTELKTHIRDFCDWFSEYERNEVDQLDYYYKIGLIDPSITT